MCKTVWLGAVVLTAAQVFGETLSRAEQAVATSMPGTGHVVTSGTNGFNGIDVGAYLGANAFYGVGVTGQNAIAANVEAGHVWSGHESLGHVTSFTHHTDAFGTTTNDLVDRHATWAAHALAGRGSTSVQRGIAYGAELRSGAIATNWASPAYALGFSFNANSFVTAYGAMFGTVDVVNSSWGFSDSAGMNVFTVALDGLATTNPRTTLVASAGNAGPNGNTVGSPGAGYNGITAGALQLNVAGTEFDTVAGFSSRGPSNWQNGTGGTVVNNVRSTIDIVAPGTNLTLAFYGGQTGGNNTTLSGSAAGPSGSTVYALNVEGTSFAAPIVAGAATLLDSYAKTHPTFATAGNNEATDSRVVKAVLLNSADKITGWNNGQAPSGGIITTTQSLDYALGAGALNIGKSFDQFTEGTTGVVGTVSNSNHLVNASGWDLGATSMATGLFDAVYRFDAELLGGSDLTATLTWFRERRLSGLTVFDDRQADLDLYLFRTDALGTLLETNIIAQSISTYNVVEHLHLTLPDTGYYGLAVDYFGDNFTSGFLTGPVTYGLAWSATAVPEPGTVGLVLSVAVGLLTRRRRRAA